jgi:nitroimidazol reductase NimA-like FMN-containing flavoprotein (pyridoxamine 5'-phosphate oxidase superfamily)
MPDVSGATLHAASTRYRRPVPLHQLSPIELEAVLVSQRIIRVAFAAAGERYLVPMFYTWHAGALLGITTPGRKTALAAAEPAVAFQIDTVPETGPWGWTSVTGEGRFEAFSPPGALPDHMARVQARLVDAPAWVQADLGERFARLGIVPWRIQPSVMTGLRHAPPE